MSKKFESRVNSSKTNQRQRFKQGIKTYLDNNKDESLGLTRIERFCSGNFIFIAKSWDDYCKLTFSKTRIIVCLFVRAVLLLANIRFLLISIFNHNLFVRYLLADGTYLLGDSRVISFYCFIGSFSGLTLGLVYTYNELKGRLFVVKYLNDIKHKRNTFQLSSKNSNKFGIILNIFTKHFMKQNSNLFAFLPLL